MFHKQRRAWPIAIETARSEVDTAAVTGFPTTASQLATNPAMAAVPVHLVNPTLLPAPGSMPIVVDKSEVIGGAGGDTASPHRREDHHRPVGLTGPNFR